MGKRPILPNQRPPGMTSHSATNAAAPWQPTPRTLLPSREKLHSVLQGKSAALFLFDLSLQRQVVRQARTAQRHSAGNGSGGFNAVA